MAVTIRYNNKSIPQDNAPYAPPVVMPDVAYNGKNLPQNAIKYVPILLDPTNQPSLVVLSTDQGALTPYIGSSYQAPATGDILPNGALVLPGDVKISGYVEKIIAETTIIDGVEVTEHIRRTPLFIDMEFVIRAKSGTNQWIFAQAYLNNLFTKIIYPQSIIYVANTMLNPIGVSALILKKGSWDTMRGNINVPMTLKFKENMPGQSLIIPPPTTA